MVSIAFNSSQEWLMDNSVKVDRFIRRNFHRTDENNVWKVMMQNPEEAVKLILNFSKTNKQKILEICEFMITSPQLTCVIFGDQRMGKDATACYFIQKCMELMRMQFWRIVTLGNIKKPPWVADTDMYFNFLNIPNASGDNEVIVYCSEIEAQFPSREGIAAENRSYNILEGTNAQNHIKIAACVKLASKVDINIIRSCNMRMFKFTSPDKLNVEGTERKGIISGLGQLLLPSNRHDKSKVLVSFDNNLYLVSVPLVEWWNTEYSEMFSGIGMDKVKEFIESSYSNDMKVEQIAIAVKQKFRKFMTKKEIADILELDYSERKITI